MEFVEGELLSARVAQGPLPVREAIDVGLQVADALDEAHSRGIIHRDIKSANLIRTDRGLVKVLDFGLAKFQATTGRDELVTQQQMTIAGMVVGTISHMAPSRRSDEASIIAPLLARRRALRDGDRPDPVRRGVADRDRRQDSARDAGAAVVAQRPGAEGAGRDRRARWRSRRPSATRRRATCARTCASWRRRSRSRSA